MEKSTIAGVSIGVIGLFLFVLLWQRNDAAQEVHQQRLERDQAEFDKDFAEAWGQPKARVEALEKRASEAQSALDEKVARANAQRSAQDRKLEALQGTLEDEMASDSNGAVGRKRGKGDKQEVLEK
jgi:hypothetical protein